MLACTYAALRRNRHWHRTSRSISGRKTRRSGPAEVAIIERKLFGGTCVNTGCIPTKTLVASAYAAHMARRAADYGVVIPGPVSVDMRAVKARKDQISGKSRNSVENWLKGLENCTVYEGHARFESRESGSRRRATADSGADLHQCGWPGHRPRYARASRVPYFTNSSMMHVDFLPRHW